jgi:7-keto-8-aminopelargonate synthetase-like enzyme
MRESQRDKLFERLAASRTSGLYPYNLAFERVDSTHVQLDGQTLLMASSYDYLSLIGDPRVEEAAVAAIRKRGTATGGVRLLTGSIPEHRALERRLAAHYGTEDCVTFSSGYFANIGAMAAWGSPQVLAHVDVLSHRSVLDACILAGSPIRRFRHVDLDDLERRLARAAARPSLVFVESLYSMDGDLTAIEEAAAIAGRAGVPLLVDDAHGLGVLDLARPPGRSGGRVTAWTGSLSKAIPSNGGFIATDCASADRIRHLAGPYIFSAAPAPGAVAAAIAALDILAAEPARRERLRANIRDFRAALPRDVTRHDPGSPIFPIRYRSDEQALRASAVLREAGIFATPIVSPAVGPGQARLRICINAAHLTNDLTRLAQAVGAFDHAEGIDRHSSGPAS